MRKMKLYLSVMILSICAISCGQTPEKSAPRTMEQLYHEFVDVMLDSTANWDQVTAVTYPFADSVCAAATDASSLKNRMIGQKWGYAIIDLMIEKYCDLTDAGEDANYDDVHKVVANLSESTSVWFYDPDERLPNIWRDHYYMSNKTSEEPSEGFFHIMVTLPTKEQPEPTLRIFYPESAADMPAIIFREHSGDNVVDDDLDMKKFIVLDNWYEKEVEEGMPMRASADEEVVKMMLSHPVMFLLFQSGNAPDGTTGEAEVAKVNLVPLHDLWKEHVTE